MLYVTIKQLKYKSCIHEHYNKIINFHEILVILASLFLNSDRNILYAES